jgi:PII-like signaling protein
MMLSRGAAKKVTIYINEDTRHRADALWSSVLHFLHKKHVAGATVLRPMAGFGAHHVLHSLDQEERTEHMPVRIEFIDSADRVNELLPALYEMVEDGVIELQDTEIIKAAVKGKRSAGRAPHAEIQGPAKLIRIYLGEADRFEGESLFEAILKRLLMMEVAGATVNRGILGFGAKRRKHQARPPGFSRDCPIMISVIEQPARVDEIIEAVGSMIQDGLIVISDVEAHRFVRALPEDSASDVSSRAS